MTGAHHADVPIRVPTDVPAGLRAAEVPEGLLRWARLPGAAAALHEARDKLEHGKSGDRVTVLTTTTTQQRNNIGRLVGLEWQTSNRPLTLGLLRTATTRAGGNLEELLARVGGPLVDRVAERDAAREEREKRLRTARAMLTRAGLAEPVADLILARRWLGTRKDGSVLDRARLVAAVLAAMPGTSGSRLLADLATEVTGDPHALDRDRDLGRTLSRTLTAAQAHENGQDLREAVDGAFSAARWRAVWAANGVICDRVSSTVLMLNVRLNGTAAAAAMSQVTSDGSEPLWVTARSLEGTWRPDQEMTVVRVCENPSVVESAADQLGQRCAPLVCTYGRPSGAAWALLTGLAAAGVRLLISADRDKPGEQIASDLLGNLPGSQPWCPQLDGLYEEERLAGLLEDLLQRDAAPGGHPREGALQGLSGG